MPIQSQRHSKKRGTALQGPIKRIVSHNLGPHHKLFSTNDVVKDNPIILSDKGPEIHKPGVSPLSQEATFDKFVIKLPDGEVFLKNTKFDNSTLDDKTMSGPIDPTRNEVQDIPPRVRRPWSKKETIFQNSRTFSFGMALKILGILPLILWPLATSLELDFQTPLSDKLWQTVNEKFNLPKGYLEVHRDLDLIARCDERLLPRWPMSPGPLARDATHLLLRPKIIENVWVDRLDDARVYETVRAFGIPNYRGARIKINPTFHPETWLEMLQGYDDLLIIDFMNYGWPAGYESTSTPVLGLPNHSSGLKHPKAVRDYLQKESDHHAILGPFTSPPFQWHRSNPIMVRPKKDKDKFRVILDMSFPLGTSVNSHIPKLSFDGAPYKLKLPHGLRFSRTHSTERTRMLHV